MTKDELLALADRVEALSGPDRLTDAEITVALRIPHHLGMWSLNFPEWEADCTDKGRVWAIGNINGNGHHRSGSWTSAPFTASLDAAMSLVPGGWRPAFQQDEDGTWSADLLSVRWHAAADAATPALAMTAAALRAQAAALENRNDEG